MTKTTLLGILTIVGAVVTAGINFIATGHFDYMSVVPAITGGWGLIHAKDQTGTKTLGSK